MTLTFNETVELLDAQVFGASGTEIPVSARSVDNVVDVTPEADLGAGTIVVTYELRSADGHVVSGSTSFAVGAPTTASPSMHDGGSVEGAHRILAIIAALGLALLTGGRLVTDRLKVGVVTGWLPIVALSAGLLWLVTGAVAADGGGWRELTDWTTWLGSAVTIRGLGLACTACVLAVGLSSTWRKGTHRPLAVAVLIGVGALIALPGPATSAASMSTRPTTPAQLTLPLPEGGIVTVEIDSPTVGPAVITVLLSEADGSRLVPFADPELSLSGTDVDLGRLDLAPSGAGYTAQTVIPRSGDWEATVSVRLSEFENPVVSAPFTVH